ncbi:protein GVQW3-like [Rhopilema esculentum]|uniref:protein GVQW3-like n=1 Tax=Rhopilema esculentum TaxID=499914 RepID=UPI0031D80BF8
MELERCDFRAMIYYDFKRGLKQEECLAQFLQTFGDNAPSRATVFRWFAEFKRGRESLKDETHPGRPPTAVVPETVAAVEKMLRQDGRMTYSMMQDSIKIGAAALHTILHENLQVRKVAACWVPHCFSDEQKEQRVNWCQFMLQKFNEGKSKRVYDIVTGDKSWVYQFDPETKP